MRSKTVYLSTQAVVTSEPEQKSLYCTGERNPSQIFSIQVFVHDESIEIVVLLNYFARLMENIYRNLWLKPFLEAELFQIKVMH